MSQSPSMSPTGIGRLTGLLLGIVAFVCLTMIGLSGYLKYELDRAETALMETAPSSATDNGDAAHAAAQKQAQFWGMLLMIEGMCASFFAVILTAGIYLTLRDRNSAPLRALAQSVKNMAKGDMRTSIWGMERRDSVGELARAVDMARYQFSQIPDLTLLSEEGPLRLRFEGKTRSMFDAMMSVINRDSAEVHEQAARLNTTVTQQQDTLALLIARVEAVLQKTETRAMQGDYQVRMALQNMLGSAESLKNSQEHAADQLNRIIPFMQDRAQGLSEITQITGRQVAQVLQSLMITEHSLRQNATDSGEVIHKLSSTADNLGERLFGAVNLLQASGKILSETTEKTQSRLHEAIENLKLPSSRIALPAPRVENALVETTAIEAIARIENAIEGLDSARTKMETLLAEQAEATKAHIDLLTVQSTGLLTQTTTASMTMASSADKLRDEQEKFDLAIRQFATRMQDMAQRLESKTEALAVPVQSYVPDDTQNRLADIATQIGWIADKVRTLCEQKAAQDDAPAHEPEFVGQVLQEVKAGFDALGVNLERTRDTMMEMTERQATQPPDISEQMRDQWFNMAAQIEATRTGLAQIIAQEVSRLETSLGGEKAAPSPDGSNSLRDAQLQIEQQTNILSELVATLSVLDEHMQAIRAEVTTQRRQAG